MSPPKESGFNPPDNPGGSPGFIEQTANEIGAAASNPIEGAQGFVQGVLGLPWDIADLIVPYDPNKTYPSIFGIELDPGKPDILTPKTEAQKGGDKIGMVAGVAGLAKGAFRVGVKITKSLAKSSDDIAEAAADLGRGSDEVGDAARSTDELGEEAQRLKELNGGKNRVETPEKRIDLDGKGHRDPATGQRIETPHVHDAKPPHPPNSPGAGRHPGYETHPRPATQQDLADAAKALEDTN